MVKVARYSLIALFAMLASVATADKIHDNFNANRQRILDAKVLEVEGTLYLVGEAESPANRGDSVGYAKAEENAKWQIGDRYFADAPWGADVKEEEKRTAWLEYRSQHSDRFSVIGLQRIYSNKPSVGKYLVVYAVPSEMIHIAPPTAAELAKAVSACRERKHKAEEAARLAEEKARLAAEMAERKAAADREAAKGKAGYREEKPDGTVMQVQTDEDMMF